MLSAFTKALYRIDQGTTQDSEGVLGREDQNCEAEDDDDIEETEEEAEGREAVEEKEGEEEGFGGSRKGRGGDSMFERKEGNTEGETDRAGEAASPRAAKVETDEEG